jgi:hypothetical protein
MDSVPPPDPDLALDALAARVDRELARLQGAGTTFTELVGGWARIGAGLDHLLRAVFTQLCAAVFADPQGAFARVTGQPWELARASAGQALWAVQALAPTVPRVDPALARVLRQCAHPTLARTLELRNELIHARRDPTREELGAVLRALRTWIAAARG